MKYANANSAGNLVLRLYIEEAAWVDRINIQELPVRFIMNYLHQLTGILPMVVTFWTIVWSLYVLAGVLFKVLFAMKGIKYKKV